MKRHALLIGNTGGLPGVIVDLENYENFLLSDTGGAWNSSEIEIFENPSSDDLRIRIDELKNDKRERLDYCFIAYCGHGAQIGQQVVIEINSKGDVISANDLKEIAPRQVNIFDCCRVIQKQKRIIESRVTKSFSREDLSYRQFVRKLYEEQIMGAVEQNLCLYACSTNESANDTKQGGLYSYFLISAAKNVVGECKTFAECHQEARKNTYDYSVSHKPDTSIQTPTANFPRCFKSQSLIMSINPKFNMDNDIYWC